MPTWFNNSVTESLSDAIAIYFEDSIVLPTVRSVKLCKEFLLEETVTNSSLESWGVGAQKILDAAEALFAEHGYHGVSVQDIAKAAEVSKANVYHHFSSKEDLYFAVIKNSMQEMNELLNSFGQDESSTIEQISSFSKAHLEHLNQKPQIAKLVLRELLDGSSDRCRALAQDVFSGHFTMLQALVGKAQESGVLKKEMDLDHMVIALVGLNVFLFQAWPALQYFPEGSFQDQAETGNKLFELLLNGLVSGGEKA